MISGPHPPRNRQRYGDTLSCIGIPLIWTCLYNIGRSIFTADLWRARGGSVGIRILYTTLHLPVISIVIIGDMRLLYIAGRQISAPSVPSCVHANDISFKRCVVVKGPHSCRDRCYCSRQSCKSRVQLQASEIGETQAPVAHERRVLSRPDLHHIKDLFLCFLKILT